MRDYWIFWARAFGLRARDLAVDDFMLTTTGNYVEKHQSKYVFYFQDLATKKRILAGQQEAFAGLSKAKLKRLGPKAVRGLKLEFHDLDYGLRNKRKFCSVELISDGLCIRTLSVGQRGAIRKFSKGCSVDDLDTLDLTFKDEYAVGLFDGQKILGIARYAKIRSLPKLVDVTVLLLPAVRGQGYSTPLVSKLIEKALARGLRPKYRVAKSNLASRAVAERLGFVAMFSLVSYRRNLSHD
jgi:GNAT superfamily N-acetyltransferase